jgi:FMN-dependent NADH-azoreductase
MNILHIDSSALGLHSASRPLTAGVVSRLLAGHPGSSVDHLDLAANPLPHWAPDVLGETDVALAQQFLDADVVVIGVPMYNFSIPSTLKAWIDRIAVAGVTFRYGPNGPEGLAGGRTVYLVSARGGRYEGDMAAMDHQEAYLRILFGFLGVTDLRVVRADGLAMGGDREAVLQDALTGFEQDLPGLPPLVQTKAA